MRRAIVAVALVGAAGVASATKMTPSHAEAMQGVGNVAQGVAQVGKAAVNGVVDKANQFVDQAGNVYTVLKDATGHATNFVMNAAGAIFDVTKMTGEFVIDAALDYPGELAESIRETRQDLAKAAQFGANAAAQLGKAAMQARPELPPLKQMHKPNAWIQTAGKNMQKANSAFDGLEGAFSETYTEWEEKYCSPAELIPSKKQPTTIIMPSFEFTISMGECTVVPGAGKKGEPIQVDCIKPYMKWEHFNGTITHKHHSAVEFRAKECKIEKEHGTEDELVLYEFKDNSYNIKEVANQISSQVGNAVGAIANGATNLANDVTGFVSGLKKEKSKFNDFVNAYDGLPQPTGI
jgi:hypothetical protein